MKKDLSAFAVTVILLSIPFIASAQLEKGKFVLGGSISYYKKFFPSYENYSSNGSWNSNSSNYENFGSNLDFGYLISDNFQLGLYFGYFNGLSNYKYSSDYYEHKSSSKNKSFGLGLALRYYQPIVDKLYLFGQLQSGFYDEHQESENIQFYRENDTTEVVGSKSKKTAISTSIAPGLSYLPVKWLAIELTFGGITWSQSMQQENTSEFDFNLNFRNLSLGSRFYF